MTSRSEFMSPEAPTPRVANMPAQQVIDHVVRLSVDAMGVTCGSLTVMNLAGEFKTVHATHTDVVLADFLQFTLDEGPCLEAARTATSIVVTNLREEDRWPRWSTQAVALGFESIVSAAFQVGERQTGSLNLYGAAADQFTASQTEHAQALAAMTSLFLDRLNVEQHLHRTITSRNQVGQAQGILMERFDITCDQAFAVLRRYSQTHSIKLRDVATRLVDTRQVAGALVHLAGPDWD